MDDISKLLREARPLYHRRRAFRRAVRYHCAVMAIIAVCVPAIIRDHKNNVDINSLYTELYSNGAPGEYYIDEFDAIGII